MGRTAITTDIRRFKEYSGAEAGAISLERPDTLRTLEEIPTLLMYEVGAGGPHARLVRHGRIRNLRRQGNELAFDFELDPQRAYLDRGVILSYAEQLGMHRFEQVTDPDTAMLRNAFSRLCVRPDGPAAALPPTSAASTAPNQEFPNHGNKL